MKFTVEIDIMPHRELLDPQGKTVAKNMKNIQLSGIEDIRIGKHIKMTLSAATKEEATEKVNAACQKLLANLIMENYTFEIQEVTE